MFREQTAIGFRNFDVWVLKNETDEWRMMRYANLKKWGVVVWGGVIISVELNSKEIIDHLFAKIVTSSSVRAQPGQWQEITWDQVLLFGNVPCSTSDYSALPNCSNNIWAYTHIQHHPGISRWRHSPGCHRWLESEWVCPEVVPMTGTGQFQMVDTVGVANEEI